ncbi:transporter substrate-binding domain-containing protein (plasmid) [Sinorhizobium meliloti]|nr:transporter substrate-binding domain-containing protein [Sinorhizobium meliloti]
MLCDAEAFALKKGNPLGLKSYKDIADNPDAKIGAPGGGTEEKLALEAGVPPTRVIVVPDGQSGLKDAAGRPHRRLLAAGLSINDLVSKANDPNVEVLAPVEGAPVYCDGAAFRKGDEALRDAFDVELAKLKESANSRRSSNPMASRPRLRCRPPAKSSAPQISPGLGLPAASVRTTRGRRCGRRRPSRNLDWNNETMIDGPAISD